MKGPQLSVGEVVGAALAASRTRLRDHEPLIRADLDPEGVHQARVATRRLRSDLRTFGAFLESEWVEPLRGELAWYAALLGEVRDADVMLARLQQSIAGLPETDRPIADPLVERLQNQRAWALQRLAGVMDGKRHAQLLQRLDAAVAHPRWTGAAAAGTPAAGPVRALLRRQSRRLRRTVGGLGPQPSDPELHAVRIAAKRCRYAAEASIPVPGRRAERVAAALCRLQDVLGELHDSVVAEQWLRDAAAELPETALVAGELAAANRAEAQRLRALWRPAWKNVRRAQAALLLRPPRGALRVAAARPAPV